MCIYLVILVFWGIVLILWWLISILCVLILVIKLDQTRSKKIGLKMATADFSHVQKILGNCAGLETAATTSKIWTEHTIANFMSWELLELKELKYSNCSLVPSPLAKNLIWQLPCRKMKRQSFSSNKILSGTFFIPNIFCMWLYKINMYDLKWTILSWQVCYT